LISSISLTQIEYVLALEKEGSFSKAAHTCYVTQSTLSTMIKKTENQLGLQIFDRKSKPIRLTDEGQLIIHQLRVIYQEYENLEELIQKTKKDYNGTFRIGIIPTIAPFLLPLFLDKLISQYPGVQFSIDEITTNEIINRIKLRNLDIGIISLPATEKEMIQKSLYLEEFLVYDASTSVKASKKYKIKDIDVNRLWLLEESHCMANQIEKICHLREKHRTDNNLLYNSGSILSLLELVSMNKGITLVPKLAANRKNLIEETLLHQMADPVPVREIGVIMHSNFTKKRILEVLEAEIKQAVKPYLKATKKVTIIKPF